MGMSKFFNLPGQHRKNCLISVCSGFRPSVLSLRKTDGLFEKYPFDMNDNHYTMKAGRKHTAALMV